MNSSWTPLFRIKGIQVGPLSIGIVLGAVLAGSVLFFVLAIVYRDTLPPLTAQNYEAAVRRWEEHGPSSYDLDVTIQGRQPGVVHVEVRDGKVTLMSRDGVVPKQRRTWDVWTVSGQFDMIGQELEKQPDPVAGFGAPPGSRAILQAEFDPQLGYPRRYRRTILGSNLDVEWETTRFESRD